MYLYALLPREFFPAVEDDLRIRRHLFHEEAAPAERICRNQRRAASTKRFNDELSAFGERLDVGQKNLNRLNTVDDRLPRRLLVSRIEFYEVSWAILLILAV